jgi:hypothetical protein
MEERGVASPPGRGAEAENRVGMLPSLALSFAVYLAPGDSEPDDDQR